MATMDSVWKQILKKNPNALPDLLLTELVDRHPEILAKRYSSDIHAIVYKIDGVQDGKLHEIAFFNKDNDKFKFSHSFNITELTRKYTQENKTALHIRQLGDVVLQSQALTITDFSGNSLAEINQQLDLLKEVLRITGGVGIAANQCLNIKKPFKIVLAGVDYENPEHLVKAIIRYPFALFPKMQVYVNPEIIEISTEQDIFPEGCLSMQGALRGRVLRPKEITVRYHDLSGKQYVKGFVGTDARVMLHECDHINNGKVYIQRIIEELSISQLQDFLNMTQAALSNGKNVTAPPAFVTPKIVFERDTTGQLILTDLINESLKEIPYATLEALQQNISQEISKR